MVPVEGEAVVMPVVTAMVARLPVVAQVVRVVPVLVVQATGRAVAAARVGLAARVNCRLPEMGYL